MPLDISALVSAVDRLRDGLARHRSEPMDDHLHDGLILRFEVTYELCHRLLRRFIRQTAASPEDVDRMAFQDLIRTGNQQGLLLGDWPAWHRYRDLRAKTSHVPGRTGDCTGCLAPSVATHDPGLGVWLAGNRNRPAIL